VHIETEEPVYTLDGEVLPLGTGEPTEISPTGQPPRHLLEVRLGPSLQLALVHGAAL